MRRDTFEFQSIRTGRPHSALMLCRIDSAGNYDMEELENIGYNWETITNVHYEREPGETQTQYVAKVMNYRAKLDAVTRSFGSVARVQASLSLLFQAFFGFELACEKYSVNGSGSASGQYKVEGSYTALLEDYLRYTKGWEAIFGERVGCSAFKSFFLLLTHSLRCRRAFPFSGALHDLSWDARGGIPQQRMPC